MRDRIRQLIRRLFGVKDLPIRKDWMRLEAGDIAGCRVPYLVHFDYHRYFWTVTSGKDKAHIMYDIILN